MHRKLLSSSVGVLMACSLAACGGSHSAGSASTGTTTTPTSSEKIDVSACLNQMVGGRTVASIAIPDVLTLDMTKPGGFPNGRQLQDPVIDLLLNALFLNVQINPVTTLSKLPLDPSGNDEPLPGVWPYLAPAQGGTPAATGGSGFVFRTDPPSAYTRVDRMGEPAVSTALIDTADKSAYNDDNPTIDKTGKWAATITNDLTTLATALRGQLTADGLTVCSTASPS